MNWLAGFPWWMCLLIGLFSYVFLNRIASSAPAPITAGAIAPGVVSALFRGLATVGQYLMPMLCVLAAVTSAWRRKQRTDLLSGVAQGRQPHVLEGMTWREFEMLVGESYRQSGYQVTETGGGGPDGGIDLVLRRDGEKILVQCKQWKAYKVGVTTIRELYGVITAEGASGGVVVTSGRFTEDAKAFAHGKGIDLIEGTHLLDMIRRVREKITPRACSTASLNSVQTPLRRQETQGNSVTAALPQSKFDSVIPPSPVCPRCSSDMTLRTAKKGALAGREFWGCTAFPQCHGTRPAQ